MATDLAKLKERADAAELRLKAATAAAQLRLVRNATAPSASASVYRDPQRTGGYASTQNTRRAGAKRFSGGGADRHLTPAAVSAGRNTIRDMVRNNPVARALSNRVQDIVVGSGLRLQAGSASKAWNNFLELKWAAWLETAVVNGRMGGLALQRWIAAQPVEAGDGAIVKYGDDAGPDLSGRIHLVEAEQIDAGGTEHAKAMPYGVKRSECGLLEAVCIRQYRKDGSIGPAQVVDAAHVVMVENVARVSQTRGEPELLSSLEVIADLFDLYQAHLDAARLGATLPLVSSTESPQGFAKQFLGETRQNGTSSSGQAVEPGSSKNMELGTGVNMLFVGKGETVTGIETEFPKTSMVEFGMAMQGMAAAVCGIPVNILMLNLGEMSYSGGRMALYTAVTCTQTKRDAVARALRELLEWKIAGWAFEFKRSPEGKAAGKDGNGGAELPADWRYYRFVDPPLPSLDPIRDIQADILLCNNNMGTKQRACEARGDDFEVVAEQRKREVDLEREYQIVPPLAPGAQGGGSPDGGRSGEADGTKPKQQEANA